MRKKKTIKIGIVGLGVVGQGVWKHICEDRAALEKRLGVRLEMHKASVRDLSKKRDVKISKNRLTTDSMSVATDPEVDIVCELMGGTTVAKDITIAALKAGKVVVTANKALICEHGEELFQIARENNALYFFEASVGGGIPVIKVLREGLIANRFPLIYGILNGTCNYILTRMERESLSFETIVEDARRLGYVEADESLDIDGWDTAHKAIILAYLAHGKWVDIKDMSVEGIRNVTLNDIQAANRLGYKIKLLGIITRDFEKNKIFVCTHPTLIPKTKILANVDDVFNGVSITGDVVGGNVMIGRGAGQDATASSIISDIVDAVASLNGAPPPVISEEDVELYQSLGESLGISHLEDVISEYYLRLEVKDKPGVLAEVATIMARHHVSIASVLQEPAPNGMANLILTTHQSNEMDIRNTIQELDSSGSVSKEPFLLRIANFND